MLNAAKWGRVEFVSFLLRQAAVLVNERDLDGNTALIWAVRNKYADVVALLLDAKTADANLTNKHGQTALSFAMINKDAPAIHTLSAVPNINLDLRTEDGCTPLIVSARFGNLIPFDFSFLCLCFDSPLDYTVVEPGTWRV